MRRKLLLIAAFCFISLLKGFSQNNALHFDGTNDFVTIPAIGTNLTSFSIEAWINPETIASDMALVNTDAWATGSVHFQFLGGKLMLSINGLNTAETSGDWPKMTTNPTVNVWQHIAMTYDGVAKKIIFYLNGVESGSYNTPTMPVANLTNATIGGWYGGRLYKGSMDEFRIWNIALTSADINANMKSELVGTESGLIAYYNFNQGVANGANNTATSLLDKTSNHFNGTLTNFDLGYTSNWIERTAGNNCLQFDGVDDYVDISATDAPNFSAGISITGYIKWNKFNSWSRIIDMGTGSNADNIQIANNGTSSNLTFSIRKGSAGTDLNSQTNFNLNQWYYIAFTVSATGEAKIYVDGVLEKTVTGFNLPNTLVRTKQYIGKSNWSSDAYFNGCIDNLSIWNKTLNQAEVTTGATDFVGNEAGLLHYYRFNQGTTAGNNTTVTTLTDAVTAGKKDGALNNFTLQPTGISNWTAGFVIPSAPGAPTAVTAVAGNFKANVSFTPPTSNGGSPITNYTVTSNPDAKTGTGTQSPIAVTGLTSGQAYTFTVVASNSFGSSVASSASAPVTPFSAPTPVVTSVAVPTNGYYKTGDTLTFTVNFDIPETVTGNPSLTIGLNTGGNVAAAYVSGSGTSSLVFRYTVAEGNIDDDGITIGAIDLNGGTIQSAAGADADLTLKNVAATTGIKVDAVAPKQISINLPTQARIMGQDIEFVTNFNDNVIVNTTLGVPFMQLMIGASTARANYVSGSGTQQIIFRYTVANNDYDADGIGAILNVQLNGATFKDATGNNVVFMSLPNTFIPLASVKVDGVVPTITSVSTPANGNFITGQPLTFTMNFNEPVVVATSGGNPYINLTIGNNTVIAAYVSGSGTSALVFSYTVASGDLDIDGMSIASSITANDATLKDVNGNNALLTFATPNLAGVYVNLKVPTVTTQAITAITATTATGNGTITDLGTPNPIQYGIVWSTASNPTVALSTKTEQGVATATGSFTSTITNLMPLTQYFVKAFATNYAGTSYGDEVSFTTLDAVPNAPTDVVATAGVLQATVSFNAPVSNGGSAIISYTVTSNPGSITATGTSSPLTVTGLTNGTPYTFTVVATNSLGNSNPSSASAAVIPFVDTEKPVITGMPSNITVSTDAGKAYATVSWIAPTATDNVGVTSF
ncbi:MAG TPA: hypothetical protein DIW31_02100, partial [Bacteroidales bacterium]|nr:hypothetical protein [Bacteroidales bacterium]